MKKKDKKERLGSRILRGLHEFREVLESGQPIEKVFKVRKMKLKTKSQETPDNE